MDRHTNGQCRQIENMIMHYKGMTFPTIILLSGVMSMRQNKNNLKQVFADLEYGVSREMVTKCDFWNCAELCDLLNGYLDEDDQILPSLSEDPDEIPTQIRQETIGKIRKAMFNAEIPYTERTGASRYRYVVIRILETSFGILLPIIGSGNTARVTALFSLVFFNFVVAYSPDAKRRVNDLSDQGIMMNKSTRLCMQCYRPHYANGMSLALVATDTLFLHSNYKKYLPELAFSILFKDNFFKEGVINEFLNVHQNIRQQTQEAIDWDDSPFTKPISIDGGNFITCAGAHVIHNFKGKKPNSRERIVQLLPATSIDTFSALQVAFIYVFSPKLFIANSAQPLLESDTHKTILITDTRIGMAQIALGMCVKDKTSSPNSSRGSSTPQQSSPSSNRNRNSNSNRGGKGGRGNNKGSNRNQSSDSESNTAGESPNESSGSQEETVTDALGNPVYVGLDRYKYNLSRVEYMNRNINHRLVEESSPLKYTDPPGRVFFATIFSISRFYFIESLNRCFKCCRTVFSPKSFSK